MERQHCDLEVAIQPAIDINNQIIRIKQEQ